jgi:hypothetical protein
VNAGKLVGLVGVVFVLYWIISAPAEASSSVNKLLTDSKSVGDSIATFMESVLGGGGSGSTSR